MFKRAFRSDFIVIPAKARIQGKNGGLDSRVKPANDIIKHLMFNRFALILIMVILSLPLSGVYADAATGQVEGRAVNGTANGSNVANQVVTLKTYLNDNEISSVTTETDADGYFLFDNLQINPDYEYEATITYQDAEYYSEWFSLTETAPRKTIEITVYESTTSDEAVKVKAAHTIVYIEQGTLLVKEYFLFVNEGDRTYVGTGNVTGETLRFFLPRGATNMKPALGLMSCCIINTEEGFADIMPVEPGAKEVAFSYNIDYSSGEYEFDKVLYYPLAHFDFLVQGEGVKVSSDQLVSNGVMEISDKKFNYFSGEEFASGTKIVTGLSSLSAAGKRGNFMWIASGLVLLTGAFASVYVLKRKKPEQVRVSGGSGKSRQELIAEIAELDNVFEEGRLSEEDYRCLRDEKKARLVKMTQASENNGE